MPRKPPAEPIDHHYDIPRLNRAFWWSGVALTVAFVVMIVADYERDWKLFQRAFLRLDAKLTRETALAAREKALDEEHSKLIADLRQARAEVASHKESIRKLEAKLKDLNPKIYLADQQYKFTKASFDAERYKYEDRLANDPRSAPRAKKDLDALTRELDEKTVRARHVQEAGGRDSRGGRPDPRAPEGPRDRHREEDVGLPAVALEVRQPEAGRALPDAQRRRSST